MTSIIKLYKSYRLRKGISNKKKSQVLIICCTVRLTQCLTKIKKEKKVELKEIDETKKKFNENNALHEKVFLILPLSIFLQQLYQLLLATQFFKYLFGIFKNYRNYFKI